MYIFLKGTVDIIPNVDAWAIDDPFVLRFNSEDHNGWGITKAISKDEVEAMDEATANTFYNTSLRLLGID